MISFWYCSLSTISNIKKKTNRNWPNLFSQLHESCLWQKSLVLIRIRWCKCQNFKIEYDIIYKTTCLHCRNSSQQHTEKLAWKPTIVICVWLMTVIYASCLDSNPRTVNIVYYINQIEVMELNHYEIIKLNYYNFSKLYYLSDCGWTLVHNDVTIGMHMIIIW